MTSMLSNDVDIDDDVNFLARSGHIWKLGELCQWANPGNVTYSKFAENWKKNRELGKKFADSVKWVKKITASLENKNMVVKFNKTF